MKRCLSCFENIDETSRTCPVCGYINGSPAENALYLAPGIVLAERYTIGRVLESDQTSVTYVAWDNTSDVKVKIKEYLPYELVSRVPGSTSVAPYENCEASFNEGLQSFIDEAKRIYSEAGDIKLYDCVAEKNTAYMIFEWNEQSEYHEFSSPINQQQKSAFSSASSIETSSYESFQDDKEQNAPASYYQKNDSDRLLQKLSLVPLWLKIIVPSVIVVIIIGIILIASGVFKKNKDIVENTQITSVSSGTDTTSESSTEISHEDGWYQDGNDKYFYKDGKQVRGWLDDAKHQYYLDPDTGLMTTGWREIDGKKYHFENDGAMNKGWKCIDDLWYFFDEDNGVMRTGWIEQKVGNQTDKYYLNLNNGSRERGWLEVDGAKYYLNPEDSKMVKEWKQIDGKWYYFDSKGIMQKGWLELDDAWYYLDETGKMVTDTTTIDGVEYRFDSDGTLKVLSAEQAKQAFRYYMADSDWIYVAAMRAGFSWYYDKEDGDTHIFSSGYATRAFSTYYMNIYSGVTSSSSYVYPDVDDVTVVDELFNAWDYLDPPEHYPDKGTTDLQSYINTGINAAVDEIGNLKNARATDGIEYNNDEIIICAEFATSSDTSGITVNYIRIRQAGSYSFYGVMPGMDWRDVVKHLVIVGGNDIFREDTNRIKVYMDDGNVVELYCKDTETVTSISLSKYRN